jgi:hypothetical protein
MNARHAGILTAAFALLLAASASAEASVKSRYVMRGPIDVIEAKPYNPAHKDRLRTKVFATLERDGKGTTQVVLTHAFSGQKCRFDVWARPGGRYVIPTQPACQFTALSSRGFLRVDDGVLIEKQGRLKFEGTMWIRWLNYTGTIRVAVEGPREHSAIAKAAPPPRAAVRTPARAAAGPKAPARSKPAVRR